MDKFKRNKGGISIEIALSIALALIVLILVFGIFSNNLKNFFNKGQFQNVFTKSSTTAYQTYDKDYTNSQIDVGIVADPDALLAAVHQQALDRIAELAQKPQPLSDQDKIDLAEQLTIMANSGEDTQRGELVNNGDSNAGISPNYKEWAQNNYGIEFELNDDGLAKYITYIKLENGVIKECNWSESDAYANHTLDSKTRLDNLEIIKDQFN